MIGNVLFQLGFEGNFVFIRNVSCYRSNRFSFEYHVHSNIICLPKFQFMVWIWISFIVIFSAKLRPNRYKPIIAKGGKFSNLGKIFSIPFLHLISINYRRHIYYTCSALYIYIISAIILFYVARRRSSWWFSWRGNMASIHRSFSLSSGFSTSCRSPSFSGHVFFEP